GVNGTYFHKDDAPHAAEVVGDSDDEEMSVVDIRVTGTSSGAHAYPCRPQILPGLLIKPL
ncbi:unnamed protein product, partial [Sphenostylis stenocarpa]